MSTAALHQAALVHQAAAVQRPVHQQCSGQSSPGTPQNAFGFLYELGSTSPTVHCSKMVSGSHCSDAARKCHWNGHCRCVLNSLAPQLSHA